MAKGKQMNTLETKCPLLPDNGQIVIVKLKDGTETMAKYFAKPWKVAKDLQESFEPVGVKACLGNHVKITFSCDIVSWKGYK